MAIASAGSLGSANDKTANTSSIILTTIAAAEVGNMALVIVAKDNVSTVDSETNEIISVTDSSTNEWIKAGEWTNSRGASNAGSTVAIFYSKISTTIILGGTIQANFSSNVTAKAISAWEFTIGVGFTFEITKKSLLSDNAIDPSNITISGAGSAQLFVRGIAGETDNITQITPTSLFTAIDNNQTSGGLVDENIGVRGEFRIVFTGTSNSNPTWVAADHANIFISIQEAKVALYSAHTSLYPFGRDLNIDYYASWIYNAISEDLIIANDTSEYIISILRRRR